MDNKTNISPPKRITDLIKLKELGYFSEMKISFDIIPVSFVHKNYEFQAYVFFCKYSGAINDTAFAFRKCYAKGCPHNLCPHVSQAVMIANRYLKRDYKRLLDAGIFVEESFFNLEDMMVKYDDIDLKKNETTGGILTIHDFINIAKEGNDVEIQVDLEIIPAVEHFAGQENKQTYLNVNFTITTLGKTSNFQRCLSCFVTDNEKKEKPIAITTANERLKNLFNEFDIAKIKYIPNFFN